MASKLTMAARVHGVGSPSEAEQMIGSVLTSVVTSVRTDLVRLCVCVCVCVCVYTRAAHGTLPHSLRSRALTRVCNSLTTTLAHPPYV
jgi:hypothetical protein